VLSVIFHWIQATYFFFGHSWLKTAPPSPHPEEQKQDHAPEVAVLGTFKQLLSTIWTIISRPTFAFIIVTICLDNLSSGIGGFLPKYLEDQFQFTPTNSAYVMAGLVFVPGLVGPAIGSMIMEKLKLRRTGNLQP
jgi:hypothetical protein